MHLERNFGSPQILKNKADLSDMHNGSLDYNFVISFVNAFCVIFFCLTEHSSSNDQKSAVIVFRRYFSSVLCHDAGDVFQQYILSFLAALCSFIFCFPSCSLLPTGRVNASDALITVLDCVPWKSSQINLKMQHCFIPTSTDVGS